MDLDAFGSRTRVRCCILDMSVRRLLELIMWSAYATSLHIGYVNEISGIRLVSVCNMGVYNLFPSYRLVVTNYLDTPM